MNTATWSRYLIAAALILLAGAVWALAEEVEMRVEVRNEDGQEITVDVNGVTEIVTIDDLAEGEERTFDVGGHPVTIKRIGDSLTLIHEGGDLAKIHEMKGAHTANVWVTKGDGDDCGAHQKIIIKKHGETEIMDPDGNVMFFSDSDHAAHDVLILKGEDGEIDIEALREKFGDDFEEIHTEDGHRVMKWVNEGDEGHPIIVKTGGAHFMGGEHVTFRCEETGSMLIVKKDEHLLDTYLDPVTGCVMEKVDTPVKKIMRVEVIMEEETDD